MVETRLVRCPKCRKSTRYDPKNEFRPFCSARCKNEDIVAWAYGGYAIPGPAADPEAELEKDPRARQDDEEES